MNKKSAVLRRITAGAGAVALALVGAATLSTAANAVTNGPSPDQPGAPTEGTLTINKYSGAHTDNPLPENLLDGVEFTVTQVGILDGGVCTAVDLTQSADWDGLEGLFASAPDAPADPFCLTSTTVVESTVGGQAVFDLPVGIYFAQETDPGDNPIVSPVPDFYVSIPTSNGADGEGWNYDVVADPKNQLSEEPSKVITDRPDAVVVGNNVTWTLTVPIPTFNNDEEFETASVTDVLPAGLEYTSSTVTVGGTQLTPGTDYALDAAGVSWTFMDPEGLAVLDANQGSDITISLVTKVTSVTETGAIANSDYESEFNGATVPGETVPYTYWGQLKIQKNDDSSPAMGLAGAEFQVFERDGVAPCAATAPGAGSVAVGTSNASGVVNWSNTDPASSPLGLWVANVNDGPADPIPTKDYCVYETVVPAGHVAQAVSNPVTITPGSTNVANLTVVNPKKDGPNLPLTGSSGTLAMTIGGLVIIAAGAGAIMLSRRRNKDTV